MNKILSVSDISSIISNKLTFSEIYKIKGEISGYSKRGGNIYATIKDNDTTIDIISWNNLEDYKNGDEVIVTGRINFYKKTSRININAINIEKKGLGDLFKKYLDIKTNYEKKGYFNKDNKKIMPQMINKIGIITSSEGAALKDILYVLKENKFGGEVYLKNCLVQGNSASKSISEAIDYFNKNYKNEIDLLLITRGGGSFEDLFQFSSDEVIHSIYKSNIYTISAVGHESDTMLSDYVADYRAPTPSIGAQVISEKYQSRYLILNKGKDIKNKIKYNFYNKKNDIINRINKIKKYNIFDTIMNDIKIRKINLNNIIRHKYYLIKNKIKTIEDKNNVFNDGYCMLIDPESQNIIKDIDDIGYDFILIIKGKKYLIKPSSIINF
jgi:exodeoxyribonuclease VII large subunit